MTNGRIDAAEVDVLLSGDRRKIDQYLLTTAVETRDAVEAIPAAIKKTVHEEIAACRTEREQITAAAVEHAAHKTTQEKQSDRQRKLITWVLASVGAAVVIASTVLSMILALS